MRRLIALAVVLGLLVVVDLSAKAIAERNIERRARAGLEAGAVRAEIRSLPFVPRLLVASEVDEIRFEVEDVASGDLVVPMVVVELQGVELDGDRLRSKREVELVDIARGRVSLDLTQQALSDRLGQEIRIGGGKVEVSVAGRLVAVRPAVQEGALVLRAEAGLPPLVLPIPRSDLIPCVGDVTVLAGRLRVSCAIDEIPPALIRAANAAAARG